MSSGTQGSQLGVNSWGEIGQNSKNLYDNYKIKTYGPNSEEAYREPIFWVVRGITPVPRGNPGAKVQLK